MRFGKSKQEAEEEPGRGSSGDWIRHLKEGDTTLRILQEPDEWVYYWEHFSPAGFSFPCTMDDTCPGCSSDNERMQKANRRIAFNALTSFNGAEYVNAWKIGVMVADKLDNRFKRFGTLTDRDYTISKYKSSGDRWDFDVEGSTPILVDLHKAQWKDIEAMLQQSWDDAWGDSAQAESNKKATAEAKESPRRATIAATPKQDDDPPFEEEKVYKEADLRRMNREDLLKIIADDMSMVPPSSLATSDAVVDWLMQLQS